MIWTRLQCWETGKYCTLVKEVEDLIKEDGWGTSATTTFNVNSTGRKYNSVVLGRKIWPSMRTFTTRNTGGLYKPYDKCTKTGEDVIDVDVLCSTYPDIRVLDADLFDKYLHTEEQLDSLPVFVYEDNITMTATGLSGAGSPSKTDRLHLKNWLLRFKVSSERLRQHMPLWTKLLSNTAPNFASYRALISGRALAADTDPGVRRHIAFIVTFLRHATSNG